MRQDSFPFKLDSLQNPTPSILQANPVSIRRAVELLRQGGVVALPTETVYGLAGHALKLESLERIYQTKDRPTFDPLIVHVPYEREEIGDPQRGREWLQRLDDLDLVDVAALSPRAIGKLLALIERFWPGPLTIVLPKKEGVPDLATAGLPTVAIRMPHHEIFQAVLRECGFPLAAPSANRFGRISPTSAKSVELELGTRVPLIIDGGDCEIGIESTIVKCSREGAFELMRPGKITDQHIAEVIREIPKRRGGSELVGATALWGEGGESGAMGMPEILSMVPGASEDPNSGMMPGMMTSHYAPEKKMFLLPNPWSKLNSDELYRVRAMIGNRDPVAILSLAPLRGELKLILEQSIKKRILYFHFSEDDRIESVARGLFQRIREADASAAEVMVVEPPANPQEGFSYAIYDRLWKASQKELLVLSQSHSPV